MEFNLTKLHFITLHQIAFLPLSQEYYNKTSRKLPENNNFTGV